MFANFAKFDCSRLRVGYTTAKWKATIVHVCTPRQKKNTRAESGVRTHAVSDYQNTLSHDVSAKSAEEDLSLAP